LNTPDKDRRIGQTCTFSISNPTGNGIIQAVLMPTIEKSKTTTSGSVKLWIGHFSGENESINFNISYEERLCNYKYTGGEEIESITDWNELEVKKVGNIEYEGIYVLKK
jgi:hypothetical protein